MKDAMKNTIGKKILYRIVLPFLVIFSTLAIVTAAISSQYVRNWIELEIKGTAEINAVDLVGRIDSAVYSVVTTAELLAKIDGFLHDDARFQADTAIKSMFLNESIYNVWFAYEPNAFDGRDAEFMSDYPGAPSGRFIRSYILENGEIIEALDMDEEEIDDTEISPWYTTARDDAKLSIDLDNAIDNIWDYGVGDEVVYVLGITAPIFNRDGEVIGCIGADVLIDNLIHGFDNTQQSVVAVFYPTGYIFYSPEVEYAEKNIEHLSFTYTDKIREAFEKETDLFLSNEYSIFIDTQTYTYFQPIHVKSFSDRHLFMYVATPRSIYLQTIVPIHGMIAAITFSVFALILFMYAYINKSISKPINQLIMAADAISQGNIEVEIGYYTKSSNEINILSQSLHRMVEQFRIYISDMKLSQEKSAIYEQLNHLIKELTKPEEIGLMLCTTARQYFHVNKCTIVNLLSGNATAYMDSDDSSGVFNFTHHTQIETLLDNRKLAYINRHNIDVYQITFLEPDTIAACLIPIRQQEQLIGYIILENKDPKNTLIAGHEPIIIYLAEVISEWMVQVQHQDSTIPPELPSALPKPTAQTPLHTIEELHVDEAIKAMGGLKDVYERSVRLTARLLPETIEKLDKYYNWGDNNSFTTEVHALKSVMRNIGAFELGEQAAKMEKESKDGKTISDWLPFKEKLMTLSIRLHQVTTEEKATAHADINGAFVEAVKKIKEATEEYDSVQALSIINELQKFSYNDTVDEMLRTITISLEGFDCEGAAKVVEELEDALP